MWIEAARRPLRTALDSFAALRLPSDCRVCHEPLIRFSRIPVCDTCLHSLAPANVRACAICGETFHVAAPEAPALCAVCRRVPPRFDFAICFGSHDCRLRSLVHLLKCEQLRPVANVLGGKLAQSISARSLGEKRSVLAIPVPLHRAKRRQRGFNQSELIARTALRDLERSRFELQNGLLCRVRATISQTGLTRHQCRAIVRGAFVVSAPERVRDRSVMVVDDVYTTGNTLNECARGLRTAGAEHVVVATVARVYRSVVNIVPGGVSNREESPAAFIQVAVG
jgi:ComF family protein